MFIRFDRIHDRENGMALNPTKSVAILLGTPKRLKSFSGLKSCNVAGTDIQLSEKVKILGVTLDSNLHTGFITSRSGKFHLVRHSFKAYKLPSARPECAAKVVTYQRPYALSGFAGPFSPTLMMFNLTLHILMMCCAVNYGIVVW